MQAATKIEQSPNRILIGMALTMSLAADKTFQLFRQFMSRRKEISHRINGDVLDLKIYPENYFRNFSPAAIFTKWAMTEVSAVEEIPAGMEVFQLPGGLYAVFHHQGLMTDNSIFAYIYSDWLPRSTYQLDDRPHFDILSEKTQLRDPEASQEIWVPIKSKT
jgi:AraC family transcriptional regulator